MHHRADRGHVAKFRQRGQRPELVGLRRAVRRQRVRRQPDAPAISVVALAFETRHATGIARGDGIEVGADRVGQRDRARSLIDAIAKQQFEIGAGLLIDLDRIELKVLDIVLRRRPADRTAPTAPSAAPCGRRESVSTSSSSSTIIGCRFAGNEDRDALASAGQRPPVRRSPLDTTLPGGMLGVVPMTDQAARQRRARAAAPRNCSRARPDRRRGAPAAGRCRDGRAADRRPPSTW